MSDAIHKIEMRMICDNILEKNTSKLKTLPFAKIVRLYPWTVEAVIPSFIAVKMPVRIPKTVMAISM